MQLYGRFHNWIRLISDTLCLKHEWYTMKFSHYLIFSTSVRHLKDWSLQDFCTDSGERLSQCEEPWGVLRQPLQITPTVRVHITLAITVPTLHMPIIAQSIKYKYLNNPANTVSTINAVQPSWACSDCHVCSQRVKTRTSARVSRAVAALSGEQN